MKSVFDEAYIPYKNLIDDLIVSFSNKGKSLKDARNKLKIFA